MKLALHYSNASRLTKIIFVSPTLLYKTHESRMAQDLENKFGRKGMLEKYTNFLTQFKGHYEIESVKGTVKRDDLYGGDGIEIEIPQALGIDEFSRNVSSLFYKGKRSNEDDLIVQELVTGQRYINGIEATESKYASSPVVTKNNVHSFPLS